MARTLCSGGAAPRAQAGAPHLQFAMAKLPFWKDRSGPILYDNLGSYTYKVTTKEPMAQRFFDQGLRLAYGFNHGEAVSAFRKAQALDPRCAMCFWGEALALGPNINAPMSPEDNALALRANERARALAKNTAPRERALIAALASRYSGDNKADRKALDRNYADAMKRVATQFPNDPDIATLYAEAVMDVQPWDYWQPGGHAPKGTSGEALTALERALAKDPSHPGAIHYYIHLVEASDNPGRATPYAERLAALMPGAGHMVHMPSHIWYRIGRYRDSLAANKAAVQADEAYFARTAPSLLYVGGYYTHNIHFVAVSAFIQGDTETALAFADKLTKAIPPTILDAAAIVHPVRVAPYFIVAEMGSPDAMLAGPAPDARHPFITAMWRYARGVALVRAAHYDDARNEAAALAAVGKSANFDFLTQVGIPAPDLVSIASDVLSARIARATGDPQGAITLLKRAAETQERLPYMEPAYWYFPIRQSLGAALLEAGQPDEAIKAFQQALIESPNNAYALFGLARAYAAAGDAKGAKATDALFAKAWSGGNARPRIEQL